MSGKQAKRRRRLARAATAAAAFSDVPIEQVAEAVRELPPGAIGKARKAMLREALHRQAVRRDRAKGGQAVRCDGLKGGTVDEKGLELARLIGELDGEEAAAREAAKATKERLDGMRSRIKELAMEVRSGQRTLFVPIEDGKTEDAAPAL